MIKIMPKTQSILSRGQIGKMDQAVFEIIEEIGLLIQHEKIRELLRKKDGVIVDGEYVKFKPELVRWALNKQSYPENLKELEYAIISGAYELNVNDLETGEIRPATVKDLINFTKLADSYGMYGSAPVRPTDVRQPELQELLNYKISWENSTHKGSTIFEANEKSTLRVANYVYEMAQVVNKWFSLGIWIKSPFKVSYNELEIIYQFKDKGIPLFSATMPIMGTTAPIYIPGAYVQSMAELFAGVTMLKLISPDSNVFSLPIDSIRAYPFDMRMMSFVYGSPEDLLATAMQIELNKYYKIPIVAKSLLTTSKEPDAQAAAEKMANTLYAAMAGARIFTNAGLLAVDEIYSGEQVVIDYEIVQYVKRVMKGFTFDEESLGVDVIKEAGITGQYLEHQSTLQHYQETWDPKLFEHSTFSQWIEGDQKSLQERARMIARKRIAQHTFHLSDDKQKELNKIYEKAKKQMG